MGPNPNTLPAYPATQWHGPAHGVEIPNQNSVVYQGYSPQTPVNHTGQYIDIAVGILAIAVIIVVLVRVGRVVKRG